MCSAIFVEKLFDATISSLLDFNELIIYTESYIDINLKGLLIISILKSSNLNPLVLIILLLISSVIFTNSLLTIEKYSPFIFNKYLLTDSTTHSLSNLQQVPLNLYLPFGKSLANSCFNDSLPGEIDIEYILVTSSYESVSLLYFNIFTLYYVIIFIFYIIF